MVNLKQQIAQDIARAIDSCIHYNGDEKEQNIHNWVQITTDRVIGAIINSLPEPIDTVSKYETPVGESVTISVGEDTDELQLQMMSNWSSDNGYNRFYYEFLDYLRGLYISSDDVVQSKHEEVQNGKDRFRQQDPQESSNEERTSRSTDNRPPSWKQQIKRNKSGDDGEEPDKPGDKEPSKVR